jgi:hypothetical protein
MTVQVLRSNSKPCEKGEHRLPSTRIVDEVADVHSLYSHAVSWFRAATPAYVADHNRVPVRVRLLFLALHVGGY